MALRLAEHLADVLEPSVRSGTDAAGLRSGSGNGQDCYLSRRGLYSVSDLRRLRHEPVRSAIRRLMAADVLSLRLEASMLITRACVQQNLFTNRNEATELTRAVGLLQQRYGPQTILHVQRKNQSLPRTVWR